MPRIGGGGGPMVPPQTQGAGQAQETQKSDFASKVAATQTTQTQGTDSARAQAAKSAHQSALVGKAKDIAKRLAKGACDEKEATREFVSLVIEERLPQFKKKKKKKEGDKDEEEQSAEEQLEEAVTELIHRDPALAKRLGTQFKRLAQKG